MSFLSKRRIAIFLLLIFMCVLSPLVEISRHIQANFVRKENTYKYMYQTAINEEIVWTFDEQFDAKVWTMPQYLGQNDSIFFKYLSKKQYE